MTRKKRLGRGLEALLNAAPAADDAPIAGGSPADSNVPAAAPETEDIVHLNVYEIENNPFQPRREFSDSEITSLAESLKEHDILQPILVRVVNGSYQLISGERRLRAAIQADWSTIPARIREADDRLVAELAIVENLQRKDLNPIEKALSFRRYIDEHQCTQDELAGRLKIDRSTLANWMRLLELPKPVQAALQESRITAGHARALLPLGDDALQQEFCQRIQTEGWSVRTVEREVADRMSSEGQPARARESSTKRKSPQIEALETQLKQALGVSVKIKANARGKGTIVIPFQSHVEFETLRQQLLGPETTVRRAA